MSPKSPEDQFVTDILKPKYTSASALISILRPLLNAQGHLAVYDPTNSIIIADADISRSNEIGDWDFTGQLLMSAPGALTLQTGGKAEGLVWSTQQAFIKHFDQAWPG